MKHINLFKISLLLIFLVIYSSCKNGDSFTTEPATDSGITGPYFDRPLPGLTPVKFAFSSLDATGSWHWNSAPSFSPDCKEMFFSKWVMSSNRSENFTVQVVNGKMTEVQKPSFASQYAENSPVFSIDGNKIFFIARKQNGIQVYETTRTSGLWSEAQPVKMTFRAPGSLGWTVSITRNETMYLEYSGDLYRSVPENGQYSSIEKLPAQVNSSSWDGYAAVDPDEKYIIFTSDKPGGFGKHDLYISFRNANGSWTQAKNMGDKINGIDEEGYPYITIDGKYLFFVSLKSGDTAYNSYWVDARIVDSY